MKTTFIHILAVSFVVFLCILTIYSYLNRNVLANGLRQYKLVPEKEAFTELYLTNHLTLPEMLEPNKIATSSFTIRNLEYKTEQYRYLVTQEDNTGKKVISSGSAQLNHNQQKNTSFSYSVSTSEAKTKIEISLPEKKQSVHFWINNTYGR